MERKVDQMDLLLQILVYQIAYCREVTLPIWFNIILTHRKIERPMLKAHWVRTLA